MLLDNWVLRGGGELEGVRVGLGGGGRLGGVQPATAETAMSTLHSPAWAPERGSSIAQRGRSARAT